MPTAAETLPGMISQQSIGLFAPAGTPAGVIEQIVRANRAALAEPEYQRMLMESGFEPDVDSSPIKLRHLIEAEISRWTPIVVAIGLKID